jgi:hypothetical protein
LYRPDEVSNSLYPHTITMRAASLALLAASLVAVATAATITAIKPALGGVNGQTRLTIAGTGFDIRGRSNDVFIGSGLKGVFCDPVPNECTENRIVCLTDAFVGGAALPLSVRSFGFLADCQITAGCTYEYTQEVTPEVTSVTPEWVVAGDTLTFAGRQFSQGDTTVANFDFTTHLGEEERCELIGAVSASSYVCKVNSMRPGTLPIDIIMGASGRATLSGAKSIMLYPQLQGVSPAVGSLAGGTEVTLTGSSFSPDLVENRVKIQGVDCVITGTEEDKLYCTTGPNAPTSTPVRQWEAGQGQDRGVVRSPRQRHRAVPHQQAPVQSSVRDALEHGLQHRQPLLHQLRRASNVLVHRAFHRQLHLHRDRR